MRSVLVTGAGRGIGRAVAALFARQGWRVGAYDVDDSSVQDLARTVPGVVAGQLDVTDPDAWTAVLAAFGPVDVLVNNAGILTAGPLVDTPVLDQARVVDVNVKSVLYGCHAVFGHLAPGGCVVNVSSASALYGQPGLATYSATKAAVSALTEALDLEWAAYGFRVVDVQPLFVRTAMGSQVATLPTARSLGLRLSVDDVAEAVLAAAVSPRTPLRSPHRAVGLQARVLAFTGQVTPNVLTRRVVGLLSH